MNLWIPYSCILIGGIPYFLVPHSNDMILYFDMDLVPREINLE